MIRRSIRGVIVNVSSQASKRPLKDHLSYCKLPLPLINCVYAYGKLRGVTKAGLDMASRCLAKELGEHGIRVNNVNPTVVMTEMGKMAWSDPSKAAPMLAQIPIGRFAEVEDVIKAVLFLLSDASAMTTGEAFPVDGGFARM
ncbi:hypothetical protein TELCIR_15327 [Teladorsagia circumcincta]|uniref:L-xylulose reductase n=1 Tax=Teladorsagia circumcincta TaxID=45464 RepID=A0A2G9U0Q0_TELCI|nr:hypothetical protein TELCIR_15327 [Teladorsagia circumcincta]